MDLGGLKSKTTKTLRQPITAKSLKIDSKDKKTLAIILIILALFLAALAGYLAFYKKPVAKPVIEKSLKTGDQSYEEAITGKSGGKDLTQDERISAYKKSISDLEKTIQSDPNNINIMLKIASAYYNIGQIDKAIATLEKAIAIDNGNALLHNNLGNFYREKGDIAKSDAQYRKAIQLDPKLVSAYINLAINLHDREGETQKAIGILQQGLKMAPENLGMKTLLAEYSK